MHWLKQWKASSSSAKPGVMHLAIVVLWLAGVGYAGYYFTAQRLVAFDPEHVLLSLSAQDISSMAIARLGTKNAQSKGVIYHFVDDECRCNTYSEKHVKSLNEQAESDLYDVVTINLSLDNAPDFITSAPATLVLGEENELMYFGPYAQGAFCNQSTNTIGLVMKNYQQGFNAQLINHQAQGCYCQRKQPLST